MKTTSLIFAAALAIATMAVTLSSNTKAGAAGQLQNAECAAPAAQPVSALVTCSKKQLDCGGVCYDPETSCCCTFSNNEKKVVAKRRYSNCTDACRNAGKKHPK